MQAALFGPSHCEEAELRAAQRAACLPARPPLCRAVPGPGSTPVTLCSTPACTGTQRQCSNGAAAARTWHRARLPHNVAARCLGRLRRLVHVLFSRAVVEREQSDKPLPCDRKACLADGQAGRATQLASRHPLPSGAQAVGGRAQRHATPPSAAHRMVAVHSPSSSRSCFTVPALPTTHKQTPTCVLMATWA